MNNLISAVCDFIRNEEGQDIIEYGLLAAFIAIVATLLLFLFQTPITAIYQRILDYLNAASSSANLPAGP